MMPESKYILLFLLISLIPSESHLNSDGKNRFAELHIVCSKESGLLACLSEKMNVLAAYISAPEEKVFKSETDDSSAYKDKNPMPTPLFLDMLVRTTDWFSHCKIPSNRWQSFIVLKNTYLNKQQITHSHTDKVYILPLKYYIYTLEKIIT